jgi:hypothetical protein
LGFGRSVGRSVGVGRSGSVGRSVGRYSVEHTEHKMEHILPPKYKWNTNGRIQMEHKLNINEIAKINMDKWNKNE